VFIEVELWVACKIFLFYTSQEDASSCSDLQKKDGWKSGNLDSYGSEHAKINLQSCLDISFCNCLSTPCARLQLISFKKKRLQLIPETGRRTRRYLSTI
jgi:hypothetical protein